MAAEPAPAVAPAAAAPTDDADDADDAEPGEVKILSKKEKEKLKKEKEKVNDTAPSCTRLTLIDNSHLLRPRRRRSLPPRRL